VSRTDVEGNTLTLAYWSEGLHCAFSSLFKYPTDPKLIAYSAAQVRRASYVSKGIMDTIGYTLLTRPFDRSSCTDAGANKFT
jgi:hypothetical protein